MARAITIDILQLLEDKLGKEEGRKIAQAIEIGLEVIEKKADSVALQKKLELKDELTRELATKADLQVVKTELEGKIAKLDQKFNFMIILIIIALTLMNPVAAEIIKRFLRM